MATMDSTNKLSQTTSNFLGKPKKFGYWLWQLKVGNQKFSIA